MKAETGYKRVSNIKIQFVTVFRTLKIKKHYPLKTELVDKIVPIRKAFLVKCLVVGRGEGANGRTVSLYFWTEHKCYCGTRHCANTVNISRSHARARTWRTASTRVVCVCGRRLVATGRRNNRMSSPNTIDLTKQGESDGALKILTYIYSNTNPQYRRIQ